MDTIFDFPIIEWVKLKRQVQKIIYLYFIYFLFIDKNPHEVLIKKNFNFRKTGQSNQLIANGVPIYTRIPCTEPGKYDHPRPVSRKTNWRKSDDHRVQVPGDVLRSEDKKIFELYSYRAFRSQSIWVCSLVYRSVSTRKC